MQALTDPLAKPADRAYVGPPPMKTTDAIAGAVAQHVPTALPGDPLRLLTEHVRDHPRMDAAAFVVVDPDRGTIEPAAAWFSSPVVEGVVAPHLTRSYDRARPGLVETVLDRGKPLFLVRVDSWEAAGVLRAQVEADAGEAFAGEVWDALGPASMIACPVRTPLGRTLGLLVAVSLDPERPLERGDLATVSALADLAALMRERADLAVAEAAHERQEVLLKRAAEDAAASLELPEVEHQVVAHALSLLSADRVVLTRSQHTGAAAATGPATGCEPSVGVVAEVSRSRVPKTDGNAIYVPVALGPRLFGVLSAFRTSAASFTDAEVELLGRLARSSAAAMANAVDFDRERRIARALTRGFVPDSLPRLAGWELGLLYEPAAGQPAGGDVYGAWEVPDGDIALLIGDVAGKGVEMAALSAMARFFIEARSWHSGSPAETLRQANTLLRERLPRDTFVTAFLGMLTSSGLLYANAGHQPPMILPADGEAREAVGGGLPLGVDPDASYEDHALPLDPGDTVLAFTDGLVEARRGEELFGERRVREAARQSSPGSMQELVTTVHLAAKRFSGGLQDDAVLLALRHR